MSYDSKGKFEVIRILRNSVLAGLSVYGIEGFGCMEFAQPLLQSANNVVLLKCDGQNGVGWQRCRYVPGASKLYQRESWIEEQKWNIVVIARRTAEKVDADTVSPNDVASALISWFNSQNGIASLRAHDCANLFLKQSDMTPYKDDSQTYQYTSSFPLFLQVPKTVIVKQQSATPVMEGLEGV